MAALAWVKDWKRLHRQQREHRWEQYLVGTMTSLTVGVLGAGSIGAHIAAMFRPLVAEVRALGRSTPKLEGVQGFAEAEWVQFYRGLDVLVMVLPHTAETYHLVGAREISWMNRGGFLVNVGRGAVLDQSALVAALESGQLSGAQLDVFESEPLPEDSPLWDLKTLSISPHVSGPSRLDGMVAVFAENLTRFRAGRPLVGEVDMGRGY
jgi:glyoxylate/hydroxypyruvate reductase A